MAEKYGVIPKRFTKEWWEYFWMYYKWYVISIALILIAVVTTVQQIVTAPKYDVTLVYAGESYFTDEQRAEVKKSLSENVSDMNENGEKLADFLTYNVSSSPDDLEYAMAMDVKLQMSLSEDETFVFLMDKDMLEKYVGSDAENCVYAPIDNWLTVDVPEEKRYIKHGNAYAVELSGNKFFEKCGIDTTGKYLCMRFYPRENQKKFIPGYEAAVELANKILAE